MQVFLSCQPDGKILFCLNLPRAYGHTRENGYREYLWCKVDWEEASAGGRSEAGFIHGVEVTGGRRGHA